MKDTSVRTSPHQKEVGEVSTFGLAFPAECTESWARLAPFTAGGAR
jgi:hypothetical protein